MRSAKKKGSDITVDELKEIIHDVISEDLESWRETFEIIANKQLMREIRQADDDWQSGKKVTYKSWDKIKRV
jgi:hypothetical protein